MFRRFSLYIDIVTSPKYYAPILNIIESYTDLCEPITNVSVQIEKPNFVYNLLLIEFEKIGQNHHPLATLKESYNHVIVINVPDSEEAYALLYKHAIHKTLREGFYESELTSILKEYMQSELLTNENTLLDNLFNSAQNSIVITDRKGNIQYANPYFEALSEFPKEALIENSPRLIKTGQHSDDFYKLLWDTITQGKVWEGIFINKSKNSQIFYEEATITPILNSHGTIEKYLKIGKNITREKMLLTELSKEIKVAKRVLNSFLPNKVNDERLNFDFELIDFNEIGGDFIYFKKVNDQRYLFSILDVMGHGVSSALVALIVTQMFDDLMLYLPIEKTVCDINTSLCNLNNEDPDSSKFVTGIFMDIDFSDNKLTYINAGHPDALFSYADGSIVTLTSNNMILGILEDEHVSAMTVDLNNLKKILTYTDGLYENHDLNLDDTMTILLKELNHVEKSSDVASLFGDYDTTKDDATVCLIKFN